MRDVRQRVARERGLVTVELALSLLVVGVVVLASCWGLLLVTVQLRCIDTASAVARQAARGDRAALAAAEADAPSGASIGTTREGDTFSVRVSVAARPFASLPAVELRAEAHSVAEPDR